MTQKLLFYSDTHLRDFGSFPPFNKIEENGLTREMNNIINGFEFVAQKIRDTKPVAVFHCGDVFHTPEGLTTTTIHGAHVALGLIRDACKEVGATHYITLGNHDCLNEKLGIFSTSILQGYGKLILKDTILKIPYISTEGSQILRVGVVRFTTDEEHAIERLKKLSQSCDMIVTHLDFQGCAYENGWRSESIIPTNFPIPIVSGDIHCAQDIGSVHYIGSLVQNRFTSRTLSQVGGSLVFHLGSGEFERHPNTQSFHYLKIDEPEDLIQVYEDCPYKVVLQVKCYLDDEQRALLDPYEHVYIPIKRTLHDQETHNQMKIHFGSPFIMLKKYVQDNNPDAIDALDSVITETSS